jgi:hypothetical protein
MMPQSGLNNQTFGIMENCSVALINKKEKNV